MKIAVVGCGAVGSFYGARLHSAGGEVHFLLRSDYAVVARDGVRILSPSSDLRVRPRAAAHPDEIGACDLVLVGLKTTGNAEFHRLIAPLVGPETAILTLQNGLGNEEELARLFGPERILGGLCVVCLNRIAPGVIRHIAHGAVVIGEYGRPASDRTRGIAAWFRQAGVNCEVTDHLERAHWEKLVWNVPFNGLGVAGSAGYDAVLSGRRSPDRPLGPCLTADILIGEPRWESLVRELMREVIATANGLGLGVDPAWEEEQIRRTRIVGAYKASTLLDFEQGHSLELEALFLRPRAAAIRAGVVTPRLDTLCALLQSLDRSRAAPAAPT